jgi:microcompartment protein CcmK/EutM
MSFVAIPSSWRISQTFDQTLHGFAEYVILDRRISRLDGGHSRARRPRREDRMIIAKVIGTVVATVKDPGFAGKKLVVVHAHVIKDGQLVPGQTMIVANDDLGAREGDFVAVSQGSSARMAPSMKSTATDAVVIALIDRIDAHGQIVFRKQ